MPLNKSKGNMYSWVTHTHSHLAGACPHGCSYCYVQKMCRTDKYKGEPRLIKSELDINYGSGKTIFIEHMSDMFAHGIKDEWVGRILTHCKLFPGNNYVFQTKDPERAFDWFWKQAVFPKKFIMGTTIETDRLTQGCAPLTSSRSKWIRAFREYGARTFITIEPIMDFEVSVLSEWVIRDSPDFINIGADSKGCSLSEPAKEKILQLIENIKSAGIEIKQKPNLGRLINGL